MSEIERIAEGLSEVQRRAILALSDRWRLVKSTTRTPALAMSLVAPDYVEMRRTEDWQYRHQFRLTPKGIAVQDYLRNQAHAK